jgi:hypothetical protein
MGQLECCPERLLFVCYPSLGGLCCWCRGLYILLRTLLRQEEQVDLPLPGHPNRIALTLEARCQEYAAAPCNLQMPRNPRYAWQPRENICEHFPMVQER